MLASVESCFQIKRCGPNVISSLLIDAIARADGYSSFLADDIFCLRSFSLSLSRRQIIPFNLNLYASSGGNKNCHGLWTRIEIENSANKQGKKTLSWALRQDRNSKSSPSLLPREARNIPKRIPSTAHVHIMMFQIQNFMPTYATCSMHLSHQCPVSYLFVAFVVNSLVRYCTCSLVIY
jgi:hypothetical protein